MSSILEITDLDTNRVVYGENGNYIDPNIIKKSCIKDLGLSISFDELYQCIKGANVTIKEEDIIAYLDDRMDKEQPGLRNKLENDINYEESDIAHIEKIKDQNIASEYYFEPYSLYYFKKYVSNLREKCLSLASLINNICNLKDNKTTKLLELLKELDIHINEDNNIYYVDAIRIEQAFVYNIKDLYNKVLTGNVLPTYFKFKLSKQKILDNNLFESNIYPKKEIQIRDLKYANDRQFISLSEKQEEELNNNMKSNWVAINSNNEIDYNHILKRI